MTSEVEVRTFINNEEYKRLLAFFKENAEYQGRKDEETVYFSCEQDIRLRKTADKAKLMFKTGDLHDEAREEIEVSFPVDDFDKMLKILLALNWEIILKWLRRREIFSWKGFRVLVDDSKGYGKILEIEKIDPENTEETLEEIRALLKELKVKETSKDTFRQKYEWYKRNWQRLLNNA